MGEEDDGKSEFTSPPKADVMVLKLAFRDGRAFVAPAGASIHNADAWRPVQSLEELAEFLNVEFRTEVTG